MDNKEKTIYLHIGMPKTGTTSVQAFLAENKEKLSEKDILYPIKENAENEYNEHLYNYRGAVLGALAKGTDAYNEYFEKHFLNIIEKSACKNVILSEEILFLRTTDVVDIFLKHDFNVKIIIYIRKPAEYLASTWQENVKSVYSVMGLKFRHSLEQFLDREIPYSIIFKYIEKLGKENVIVRPFEKEQWKDENLIVDFLNIFGVDFEGAKDFPARNDYQYNRNFLEFMSIMKCFDMSFERYVKIFYEYMMKIASEEDKNAYGTCNTENLLELMNKYVKSEPKVINTIGFDKISEVTKKWEPQLNEIAQIYGKNTMFNNIMPKNVSEETNDRADKVFLTPVQLDVIREQIKTSNQNTVYYQNLLKKNNISENKPLINENNSKIPFYQYIFSVKNNEDKKIIRILGLKISLKR